MKSETRYKVRKNLESFLTKIDKTSTLYSYTALCFICGVVVVEIVLL